MPCPRHPSGFPNELATQVAELQGEGLPHQLMDIGEFMNIADRGKI